MRSFANHGVRVPGEWRKLNAGRPVNEWIALTGWNDHTSPENKGKELAKRLIECPEPASSLVVNSEHMALVRFTQNIQRHVACPPASVEGTSLREVMEAYFQGNPQARGYVLDDQGALRKHMAIFINASPAIDRDGLSDAVPADGTVDIVQALSGG